MKTKRQYIVPAMRAHKLKLQTQVLSGSITENGNEASTPITPCGTEDTDCAKSSRFTYERYDVNFK